MQLDPISGIFAQPSVNDVVAPPPDAPMPPVPVAPPDFTPPPWPPVANDATEGAGMTTGPDGSSSHPTP